MFSKQSKRNFAFSSLFFALIFCATSVLLPACKVKEGCPGMNQHVKAGKDGKLPSKPGKGKSSLFPRGM
jgi:hypothetical protein